VSPKSLPPLQLGAIYKIKDDAADKKLRGKLCILVRGFNPDSRLGIVKILVSGRVATIFAQELEEIP
jgi:hypothetical protein